MAIADQCAAALLSSLPVSPTQQDQYNSDSKANSEAEDEAAFNSDFDSESSTESESSDEH